MCVYHIKQLYWYKRHVHVVHVCVLVLYRLETTWGWVNNEIIVYFFKQLSFNTCWFSFVCLHGHVCDGSWWQASGADVKKLSRRPGILTEFWHLGIKQVKAHLFQGHITEQFPFISACPHYQGFSQRNFCPLYFTKVLLLTPVEGVWIQISYF